MKAYNPSLPKKGLKGIGNMKHKMAHSWMFRVGENKGTVDFGWSPIHTHIYLAGGIICLLIGLWVYLSYPHLIFIPLLMLLLSINIFFGYYIHLSIRKPEYMTLPFVDLFTSENDLILDIGCGAGRTTLALGKVMKNRRIVAFDRFDASYIEGGGRALLEQNLKIAGISDKADIVQGDATQLEFEDGKFDAAISTYALDHTGKHKLAILKEVNRVLKPKGRFLLVVVVPSLSTFAVMNILCLILTSKRKWRELFKQSGFNIIDEGIINSGSYFLLEKI